MTKVVDCMFAFICLSMMYILLVGNKKSRKPVDPEDDVAVSVLNIATLTKDMLTRQQLIKLLEDMMLKTAGNKEILFKIIQFKLRRGKGWKSSG
jgi:hypothetical protein